MLKMNLNKHDVIAMFAELAAARNSVHRPIRVRGFAASHMSDQTSHLRLVEKLAAWRRTNEFDRSEVLAERQHRTQGHIVFDRSSGIIPNRCIDLPVTASHTSITFRGCVNRGEHVEAGNLAATADAAVRYSTVTITCLAAVAAMLCFQGGHDKGNDGTGGRGSSASCTCLQRRRDRGQDRA